MHLWPTIYSYRCICQRSFAAQLTPYAMWPQVLLEDARRFPNKYEVSSQSAVSTGETRPGPEMRPEAEKTLLQLATGEEVPMKKFDHEEEKEQKKPVELQALPVGSASDPTPPIGSVGKEREEEGQGGILPFGAGEANPEIPAQKLDAPGGATNPYVLRGAFSHMPHLRATAHRGVILTTVCWYHQEAAPRRRAPRVQSTSPKRSSSRRRRRKVVRRRRKTAMRRRRMTTGSGVRLAPQSRYACVTPEAVVACYGRSPWVVAMAVAMAVAMVVATQS